MYEYLRMFGSIPWDCAFCLHQASILCPRPISWLIPDPPAEADCDSIVKEAEEFARLNGGWTTARHYAVPTTDLPIHRIPKLLSFFNDLVETKLASLLALQFAPSSQNDHEALVCDVSVHDMFVVKYSQPYHDEALSSAIRPPRDHHNGSSDQDSLDGIASQRYLPIHSDESSHSFVLALNSMDEYVGGGTYFPDKRDVMRPGNRMHINEDSVQYLLIAAEKGHLVSFDGRLLHGGDPVLQGTRFIVAGFMLLRYRWIKGGDGSRMDQTDALMSSTDNQSIVRPGDSNHEASSFAFGFDV